LDHLDPALLVSALSLALLGWGPALGLSLGSARVGRASRLAAHPHELASPRARTGRDRRGVVLAPLGATFRVLLGVLVADLVIFSLLTSTGLVGSFGPREASRSSAVALLGTKGRFALVGGGGERSGAFRILGEPNMNVFTGLSSVQGYGSLISTIYDDATGTHPQAALNPCRLADGTFTQLRLSAIVISTAELATNTSLAPVPSLGCVANTPELSTRRYFGQLLKVHTIILTSALGKVLSNGPLHVELLSRDGKPVGPVLTTTEATTKKAVFYLSRPH